jgi:hypothetical protein
MLVAAITGVVGDDQGLECVTCNGTCTVGEKNCGECEGTGRIFPDEEDFKNIESEDCYIEIIRMIYAMRERPCTPNEWLSQPAGFVAASGFLSPYIEEFEERRSRMMEATDAG